MSRVRVLLGLSTGAFAALVVPFVVASCADTEGGEGGAAPPNVVPDASSEASLPDGSCDAADPTCVGEVISCDQVRWCPTKTNVESLYSLTKVWGAAPNDVWAVGAGATVIHWDGAAWARTPVPPALPNPLEIRNTFLSIWGSGPKDVWIASTTSTIYRNTGSGWVYQKPAIEKDGERPVQAIWGDGPNRIRIGARAFNFERPGYLLTGNQITTSTVGELQWEPHEGTAWIFDYYGTPDNVWFVGDDRYGSGNEWKRANVQNGRPAGDGGLTWTESEVFARVSLHAIWGSSADDMWIVGDQGAMRRLRAGQTEWEVIPPVTNESLYAIWGSSATDIWVAGENGTILHFDGNAWTPEEAAFPAGRKKPHLSGIWGSGKDDVWIVGGHVALHYTGKKGGVQ